MTDYLNSDTTIWLENTLEYPILWINTQLSPTLWIRVPLTQLGQNFLLPVYRQAIIFIIIVVAFFWLYNRFQIVHCMKLNMQHDALVKGYLRQYLNLALLKCVQLFEHLIKCHQIFAH